MRRLARTRCSLLVAALGAAAVVLTGCGGGDDDAGLPEFAPSAPSGESTGGSDAGASSDPGASPEAVAGDGAAKLAVTRDRPSGDEAAQKVYDAYVAFWRADLKALADPSKGSGDLRDLAVEPQRRRTLTDLENMRVAGTRSRGTLTIGPRPVTVEATQAQLDDCLDDTALTTVDGKGKTVPGTEGKRVQLIVTMKLVDGAWVVANIAGGNGTC
jgi:hypothetical protein